MSNRKSTQKEAFSSQLAAIILTGVVFMADRPVPRKPPLPLFFKEGNPLLTAISYSLSI